MIERFGADTGRVFELFAAPPEKEMDWTDAGAGGSRPFLGRVFRFVTRNARIALRFDRRATRRADRQGAAQAASDAPEDHRRFQHRWHFNTSIAALMELVNELYDEEDKPVAARAGSNSGEAGADARAFRALPRRGALGGAGPDGPVFRQPWPVYDGAGQGRSRGDRDPGERQAARARFVPFGTPREALEKLALARYARIQPFLDGKQVVKVIVVPDKLVNIVVR